jgi:hypothetical protein
MRQVGGDRVGGEVLEPWWVAATERNNHHERASRPPRSFSSGAAARRPVVFASFASDFGRGRCRVRERGRARLELLMDSDHVGMQSLLDEPPAAAVISNFEKGLIP